MPASFRFSSSSICFSIGTGALLVLIVVLLTGGFVVDAGILHFSARRWTGPLIVLVAAWGAAAFEGRGAFAASASALAGAIDRHAFSLALVIACSAAAAGIGFGTYAASGADAAGYVSQSALIESGRLVTEEPLARAVAWPDSAWAFSPLGYRPGASGGVIVPTYPPGLPLVMAAARSVGGEFAAFLAVPFLGALAVLCTYALGSLLHSRTAGLTAAALLASSPIVLFQIVQPMSDVPATAWTTMAVLLAVLPIRGAGFASGASTGFLLLTRPNLVPFVLAIGVIAARPQRRRALEFAAGLLPALGALGLLQWRLFGAPWASGYGSFGELFGAANIIPNVVGYAQRLVRGEGAALSLAVAGFLVATFRRTSAADRPLASVLFIASVTSASVLLCYLPYGVFAEWSYLRFLLPALPFMFVLTGAFFSDAIDTLPVPSRGVVLAATLTIVAAVNVNAASREQAFNMRRYEARYRSAGRYLESTLPPTAIVVAVQESASARHYAHVPIVRWDLLRVDLDAAVIALRSLGRTPVLLVEDWETVGLQKRFPSSSFARLAWTPRAEFGDETRVRLFDPADLGKASVPTDRVH